MGTTRGTVELDAKLAEAVRTRLDQLLAMEEPRLARVWELALLAQQHAGFRACGSSDTATLEVGPLLRYAATLAAGAALASSPRLSDALLGVVVVRSGGRSGQLRHERRPIDPMDFWRAYCLASWLGDRASLEALGLASDWIDPDPGFEGRAEHERELYRHAFRLLCGDAPIGAAEVAGLERRLAETTSRLDEFRQLRFEALVLPLVRGAAADDADAAIAALVEAHHRHFAEAHRRGEPVGFVAWAALALLGRRPEAERSEVWASDYLPAELVALARTGAGAELAYDAPPLAARTLAEARLRVRSAVDRPLREQAEDAPGLTLVAGDHLRFRVPFQLSEEGKEAADLGAGVSAVFDPGELVSLAEQLRGASEPEQRALARACAAQALAALGDRRELFRNAMTSPLGRQLCDDHPEKFTRAALEALVQSLSG